MLILGSVYRNLKLLVEKFGEALKFERNDKFGWLTSNLNRLGTTLSCRIKYRLDGMPIACLRNICQIYQIEIRLLNALDGGQAVELSKQAPFGLTEMEYVKNFYGHLKQVLGALESGNEKSPENNCDGDTFNGTNPDKELDLNENEFNQNSESNENKVEEKSEENRQATRNGIKDVEKSMAEKPIDQKVGNEDIRTEEPNE